MADDQDWYMEEEDDIMDGGDEELDDYRENDVDEEMIESEINDDEESTHSHNSDREISTVTKVKRKPPKRWLDEAIPPLSDLNDIYAHMANNATKHGIIDFLTALGQGTIVVATMCSGTESPILALELLDKMLNRDHKTALPFHHAFSAEIVPYKQAYIQLNFDPPIIFRDIIEMADAANTPHKTATNAYGSKVEIPGNVNLLVAGSSCVDFSVLNMQAKKLQDKGESGDTLRAILHYAKEYRPAVIILENINGAPWESIRAVWEDDQAWLKDRGIDQDFWKGELPYVTKFVRVDSKDYYIPQTRMRGYMILVDLKRLARMSSMNMDEAWDRGRKMTENWAEMFTKTLKQKASASVEAFILDTHDVRVVRAQAEQSRMPVKTRISVEWLLCQGRHVSYRSKLNLGDRRPLTQWVPSGGAKAPDYWWRAYIQVQVERIWDTIDMAYLRSVSRDRYDALWKFRIWDLSQSIDRYTDTNPFGVANCITPKGMPFLTYRGAPIIGLEQLALQGLPLDRLLLGGHTHKELQDLAGNAMTSTVVGCAMLAAMVTCQDIFLDAVKDNDDIKPRKPKANAMELNSQWLKDPKVTEFDNLEHASNQEVSEEAKSSVRLCQCEGSSQITKKSIHTCQDCGHSACEVCGGIPAHNYTLVNHNNPGRMKPSIFLENIKKVIPMSIRLSGVTFEFLEGLVGAEGYEEDLNDWLTALKPALGERLYFTNAKRSHCWTVFYEGKGSRLELKLQDGKMQWSLYGRAKSDLAVSNPIRRLFRTPFARMYPTNRGTLEGDWQVRLPITRTFQIKIEGQGPLVDGWEKRLGLKDAEFQNQRVWSALKITKNDHPEIKLDIDIDGIYDLLPDCGMACGSLHKRRPSADDKTQLFLFLDPDRLEENSEDRFVFSTELHRTVHQETRNTVAQINSSWRALDHKSTYQEASTYGEWMPCKATLLVARGQDVTSAVLQNSPTIEMYSGFHLLGSVKSSTIFDHLVAKFNRELFDSANDETTDQAIANTVDKADDKLGHFVLDNKGSHYATIVFECHQAPLAVLVCKVSSAVTDQIGMKTGPWTEVSQSDQHSFCEQFAWLLERSRYLDGFSNDWRLSTQSGYPFRCTNCAPEGPSIQWLWKRTHVQAMEHPRQAGFYEKFMKARPQVFIMRTRIDDNGVGWLEIGLNIGTLAHRALGKILDGHKITGDVQVHWRIETKGDSSAMFQRIPFTLKDNKDVPTPERERFKFPGLDKDGNHLSLRIEQQRSFLWAKGQESEDALPFWRQEIAEALIPRLDWRADARVQTSQKVRGGVLADEVGYGKTAVVLALVNAAPAMAQEEERPSPTKCPGYISLKATLIIVPRELLTQWRKEVVKFLTSACKVLELCDWDSFKKSTIKDFEEADIVLVSSTLLADSRYWDNLACFAGEPQLDTKAGRAFGAWLKNACEQSEEHTDLLRTNVEHLQRRVKVRYNNSRSRGDFRTLAPSKRKAGADYGKKGKERKSEIVARTYNHFDVAAKSGDYKLTERPPLNIFKFRRAVKDEHQFLAEYIRIYLSEFIQARARWILSATPRMDNFAWVRKMLRLIQVDVGIEDDAPYVLDAESLAEQQKYKTSAERFWSFNESHSSAWHHDRQSHAQMAVHQFARKNVAEYPFVPTEEHVRVVSLNSLELMRYIRHHQRLASQKMRIQLINTQFKGEVTRMLNKDIVGSDTGPELLIKLASFLNHLDNPLPNTHHSEAQAIIDNRTMEVRLILRAIEYHIKNAFWLHRRCRRTTTYHYSRYKDEVLAKGFGDRTTCTMIENAIREAEATIKNFDVDEYYRDPPSGALIKHDSTLAKVRNGRQRISRLAKTPYESRDRIAKLLAKATGNAYKRPQKHQGQLTIHKNKIAELSPNAPINTCLRKRINGLGEVLDDAGNVIGNMQLKKEFLPSPAPEPASATANTTSTTTDPAAPVTADPANANTTSTTTDPAAPVTADPVNANTTSTVTNPAAPVTADPANANTTSTTTNPAAPVTADPANASTASTTTDPAAPVTADPANANTTSTTTNPAAPVTANPANAIPTPLPVVATVEDLSFLRHYYVGDDRDAWLDIENLSDHALALPKLGRIPRNDTSKYVTALRSLIVDIRRNTHELVNRIRELRFDMNARQMQLWKLGEFVKHAPSCSVRRHNYGPQDPNEILINTKCGHMSCPDCLQAKQESKESKTCPHLNCDASTEDFRLKSAKELTGEGGNTFYGNKIDAILDLILREIPEEDQILIFVQYEEMMEKLETAFDDWGISNFALAAVSNNVTMRTMIERFQEDQNPDTRRRVLILNSSNETSAGLNLTGPNHIIFVAPFISGSLHDYEASRVQCIGRARRYGQTKTVHIYRFIALQTIDVDVIYQREQKRPVFRTDEDGVKKWGLYTEDEMEEAEIEEAQGYEGGYVEREPES